MMHTKTTKVQLSLESDGPRLELGKNRRLELCVQVEAGTWLESRGGIFSTNCTSSTTHENEATGCVIYKWGIVEHTCTVEKLEQLSSSNK